MDKPRGLERALFMLELIVAGEAVFSLPFHVARFFRPTVLRVFELTNTELGAAQAIYGAVEIADSNALFHFRKVRSARLGC